MVNWSIRSMIDTQQTQWPQQSATIVHIFYHKSAELIPIKHVWCPWSLLCESCQILFWGGRLHVYSWRKLSMKNKANYNSDEVRVNLLFTDIPPPPLPFVADHHSTCWPQCKMGQHKINMATQMQQTVYKCNHAITISTQSPLYIPLMSVFLLPANVSH